METNNRRTAQDVIRVNELLRGALVQRQDGLYSYINGLNDIMIAESAGVPASTVRGIRKSVYGRVRGWERRKRTTTVPPVTDFGKRLDEIEAKLDAALSILKTLV